jgi:hypothetical protein
LVNPLEQGVTVVGIPTFKDHGAFEVFELVVVVVYVFVYELLAADKFEICLELF